MACPMPPAREGAASIPRQALLFGCLAPAKECSPKTGFRRITGTVEELAATGEAVLVAATSVPGEERTLAKATINQGRFHLAGE